MCSLSCGMAFESIPKVKCVTCVTSSYINVIFVNTPYKIINIYLIVSIDKQMLFGLKYHDHKR